jgi:hypothetical protein
VDLNDVVSCTSLGEINIRMLGFVIQVSITNPNILISISPSEVQETTSFKSTLSQLAHPITYIYMNLRLQLNSWPL